MIHKHEKALLRVVGKLTPLAILDLHLRRLWGALPEFCGVWGSQIQAAAMLKFWTPH